MKSTSLIVIAALLGLCYGVLLGPAIQAPDEAPAAKPVAAPMPAAAAKADDLMDAKYGNIEAKSIVLKAKDGKARITIQAFDDMVGLWVASGKGDECVCLIAGDKQPAPYLGTYSRKSVDFMGCPLALSSDTVQLCTGKGSKDVRILTLPELFKLADKK